MLLMELWDQDQSFGKLEIQAFTATTLIPQLGKDYRVQIYLISQHPHLDSVLIVPITTLEHPVHICTKLVESIFIQTFPPLSDGKSHIMVSLRMKMAQSLDWVLGLG